MNYLVFHVTVILSLVYTVLADWPSPTGSGVQLLGFFRTSCESSALPWIQSRAMFKAAIFLAQRYNITVGGQPIGWRVAQEDDEVITALEVMCSTTTLAGIVRPGFSRETHFISQFARRIDIPVVAYTASDPDLSNRRSDSTFHHTAPSDSSTALGTARLFQRYNWTSCILIYQNDASGWARVKVLTDTFEANGLFIRELIPFDVATRTIPGNLSHRLLKGASRVIVLWADLLHTSTIVREAAAKNLVGPRFVWILRASIPLNSFSDTLSKRAVGMLSVEPASGDAVGAPFNASLLNAAYEMWKRYEPESFPGEKNVNAHALFAFDATWLLIQSLQQLRSSFRNLSLCFDHQPANSTTRSTHISATQFLGVSGPMEYHDKGTERLRGIHYIVRNAQPAPEGVNFVKVLKYSEPGDWQSFHATQEVLWPDKSYRIPTDRATISGFDLRIVVTPSDPFTMIEYRLNEHGQNKSYAVGYIPDLIDLLQQRMKFVPEIVLTSSNQSYSRLIQAVARGHYDIFAGDVTVTSKRRELVFFSASIHDYSLQLIMRKPTRDQIELFAYLKPFSLSLWMAILATTICTAIIVYLVERDDNEALRDRSALSMGVMSVWYSLGNIMGYGADFHVRTVSGRLITVALYILSLVLVASYTANLASNLTISKREFPIRSIDDIRRGTIPFNRIGVRVGISTEEFYLREISNGRRDFYPVYSRDEQLERLVNGDIDATFLHGGSAEYLTNNIYCSLSVVGPSFGSGTFGVVYPKNWLFAEEFDMHVLALRESGEMDKLKRRWFESNVCQDSVEPPNAMGVQSMAGLFLTVGMIILAALLTLIWTKRAMIKERVCLFQGASYDMRHEPNAMSNSST